MAEIMGTLKGGVDAGSQGEKVHLIKANLTYSEESYKSGNGEGCWFLVDAECKRAFDEDDETGTFEGILDNDSIYYEGLVHGEILPIEMRGEFRPVVPYKYLIERFKIEF